ncbi:MAG TPA: CNNM domain-containing protein, partial [Candidatus Polarisedimenticolia bacterium]|nr:CNNM domain-containing protein [Candidatus Polarisedimenticolia bacterium]
MTIVLLLLLIALIFVNGFFVAAEFAIVRARRSRIEQLDEEGARSARLALAQMGHVDEFIATCQVGITLASLGIGFLGEPALATLFEPIFGKVVSHGIAVGISIALAFTMVTFAHVIVGEQSPKMFAIARAEPVMLRVARPLQFFGRVLHPLIVATNAPSRFLVRRLFRVDPDAATDETTSPEELRLLISRGARGG